MKIRSIITRGALLCVFTVSLTGLSACAVQPDHPGPHQGGSPIGTNTVKDDKEVRTSGPHQNN